MVECLIEEIALVNSKIPPEYWILLALKNASERHGLSLLSWYYSGIPDELIISYGQFVELLDEMEKNGFIKKRITSCRKLLFN